MVGRFDVIICDAAEGSNCNCKFCDCESECAINSLYQIRREVNCRVIHPTRDMLNYFNGTKTL